MSGVTSQGFENKQYSEIVEDLALSAQLPENFGTQFPITPDSQYGILTGIYSAALKDLWDLAGNVADQSNRDKASGKYLDDLAALIGLKRLLASNSTGSLLFTGLNSTVVPSNSVVKSTANKEIVLTNNTLTLNRLASHKVNLSINLVVVGGTYSVTVNGVLYAVTAVSGNTVSSVSKDIATLITAGGGGLYDAWYINNNIVVSSLTQNNNIATSNSGNVNLVSVSSLVPATAVTSGEIQFYPETLTTLVSPIIGITTVTNLTDFSAGREEETDSELRIRMEQREQSTGTATKPSIEASVSDLEGVTFTYVVENTIMLTDVDGRPPKSYELYVSGGVEAEIAQTVWNTKPAGIETYGTTSVVVVDNNGDDQLVKFSRFDNKYAWVRLTYVINSEEDFLPDGEDRLRAAVVETGSTFYRGEDLEPTKFYGNIYSKVTGVYITKIEVAITNAPTDTPVYTTSRLPVDKVSDLLFSVDRIPLLT